MKPDCALWIVYIEGQRKLEDALAGTLPPGGPK
jgi:hypothetical protein